MVEHEENLHGKLHKVECLKRKEQVDYTKMSRNIKKNNTWAADFDKKHESETLELWKSLEVTTENFKKNSLDMTRVCDANSSDPSSSTVTSVHFHPSDSLMVGLLQLQSTLYNHQ